MNPQLAIVHARRFGRPAWYDWAPRRCRRHGQTAAGPGTRAPTDAFDSFGSHAPANTSPVKPMRAVVSDTSPRPAPPAGPLPRRR